MNSRNSNIVFSLVLILLTTGCKKDKVPEPQVYEPTKWEKISGDYKVFDTNGIFLFDMSLNYTHYDQNNTDSLHFSNFDGSFNFSSLQSFFSNSPEMFIRILAPNPLKDYDGNSWQLYENPNSTFDNVFNNDTIRMRFNKNNLAYYLLDLIPYSECVCEQIAVKQ